MVRFARENGAGAVPLLEELALSAGTEVQMDATDALGYVVDPIAASALQRIASSAPIGELRKVARRTVHRLATLGVRAETEPPASNQPSDGQGGADPCKVLTSPIDGAGNRGIWFGLRHGADADFVSVLASDTEGVKDMFVRDMSVSRFDKEAQRVLHDPEYPWVEVPADYGRHLVGLAHRLNLTSRTPLPLEFLTWWDQIAVPRNPVEQPIVYTVIGAAEVRWDPRYLDNSGKLFELEMFRGWILDKDELAGFVAERLSAERSGLMLAGVSGESRDRMIEERAILALFDSRRRSLFKTRLEEMAYVLWRSGRLEAARSALAAALALEPADRSLADHPFIREMVHWSLEIVAELERGERTRSIRPGLQLHLS